MTNSFPYSYFRCPCIDGPSLESSLGRPSQSSENDEDEQEKTFDPRSPRANYALYPLEHLMWCEDCHEIRCPRCTIEEVVCWYCPTCLFEVASGMVRNEGTRCTRNCHNCPICTAPLAINSMDKEAGGLAGPWVLACEYCSWTTLDVGIKFDKPNNVFGQLGRIYAGKPPASGAQSSRAAPLDDDELDPEKEAAPIREHDARFKALRGFYSAQLARAGGGSSGNPLLSPSATDGGYGSPSSLARIMSLYTATGSYGKRAAGRPAAIRPAVRPDEGVLEAPTAADEVRTLVRLRTAGLEGTADAEQRRNQPPRHSARFLDDLRPVPVQLRTKRSRRCRACRHILVRPETKVSSTRYRIKLVAASHVPAMTLASLPANSGSGVGSGASTSGTTASPAPSDLNALPASRPLQFLLTLRNPMFESVRVTLATPAAAPDGAGGGTRVTVLCPTFEVGAHTDAWDAALGGGAGDLADRRRGSAMLPVAGPRVAEAGKVWDRGRDWTTVVLELVCPRLSRDAPPDADLLEIPLHVRLEYEADLAGDDGAAAPTTPGPPTTSGAAPATPRTAPTGDTRREKRELAYWCVLGVGRIARVDI